MLEPSALLRRIRAPLAALLVSLAPTAAAQDYIFSVTFDGGGWFDRSFNEATWTGLTRAVSDLSSDYDIDILIYDGSPDDANVGLRRIAASGVDLIVAAGFLQEAAIAEVSAEFPDVNFVLIDAVVDNPNVRSVLFREHEGSFLVGYLAGTMSQTGVVGFVGGLDSPLIRAFDVGYQAGVQAACPTCTILSSYIGDTVAAFNNPERAFELAAEQQAQGADIIYAAAGNSGNGVINFVTETLCYDPAGLPDGVTMRRTPLRSQVADISKSARYNQRCGGREPLFFIGVDTNQNYLGDTDDDPATLNHGLTSMLKRVDVAAEDGAYDVVDGSFAGETLRLGLAENGVGYALDVYNEALVPDALRNSLESIRNEIISGERSVPDARESAAD
ncbi:MAG: BMP family ABC transporter substrate-binding protein [Trueperaceae bacterium]|nr:BMP family ABC transporter substrate-binding protein [Trueperaceae bacterium]